MDETISTAAKSCCLSSKFSASINIPGLTQQLSVSKLKFCLLAVAETWAHITHTSVPRHLHCKLYRSHFPKWEAEKSAVVRWKEPYLRMKFTSLIPPSWFQGQPRYYFQNPQGKRKPLQWWRNTFPFRKAPKMGLFLKQPDLLKTANYYLSSSQKLWLMSLSWGTWGTTQCEWRLKLCEILLRAWIR